MELKKKMNFKWNKNTLIATIGVIVLIILITFLSAYLVATKNQRLIRRSDNIWNIHTEKNMGELIESAIKNPKYEEHDNRVTITGKDENTDRDVTIVLVVNKHKTFDLSIYKQGIQEMSLAQFITYLEQYA